MMGVDTIGEIRRAYFDEHRPIKEIMRTLSVSRGTVRKVIRSHTTEFKVSAKISPSILLLPNSTAEAPYFIMALQREKRCLVN